MNVPQGDLDGWRLHLDSIRVKCFGARRRLAGGDRTGAADLLTECAGLAVVVGTQMERAGAQRPGHLAPAPVVPLALLDTPANRRYADALRAAWEAGLEVDRERFGERIGTDGPAQMVEMLLADVEEELHGPAGARE